jgi:hypothetical protein
MLDKQMIKDVATKIQVILGTKLIDLKRRASGSLINSFSHEIVMATEFDLNLKIKGLDYWKVVNYGVNAMAIPYSPEEKSSKASSLYIEGLIKWIKIKGIASDNDVVRGIAFAIATKQTGQKGGQGKGNPMDKNKLFFVEKTQSEREVEVQKIGEIYQKSVVTSIRSLTGGIELVI